MASTADQAGHWIDLSLAWQVGGAASELQPKSTKLHFSAAMAWLLEHQRDERQSAPESAGPVRPHIVRRFNWPPGNQAHRVSLILLAHGAAAMRELSSAGAEESNKAIALNDMRSMALAYQLTIALNEGPTLAVYGNPTEQTAAVNPQKRSSVGARGAATVFDVDITSWLQPRNSLVLELAYSPHGSEPANGPLGAVPTGIGLCIF